MQTTGPRTSWAEGTAYAEALRKSRAQSQGLRGATLWVALGPGQGGMSTE